LAVPLHIDDQKGASFFCSPQAVLLAGTFILLPICAANMLPDMAKAQEPSLGWLRTSPFHLYASCDTISAAVCAGILADITGGGQCVATPRRTAQHSDPYEGLA